MSIHEKTILKAAYEIKSEVDQKISLQKEVDSIFLYNVTYTILKQKGDKDEIHQIFQEILMVNHHANESFSATLQKAAKTVHELGGKISPMSSWIQFASRAPLTLERLEKAIVIYKEYFTLRFEKNDTPYEIFNKILLFLEELPHLYQALLAFSAPFNIKIAFKTPRTLEKFLHHPDSLVIHFFEKKYAPPIKQIAQNFFQSRKFDFEERLFRVSSAFDFKIEEESHRIINIKPKNEHKASHSQLIASIVAGDIKSHANEYIHKSIAWWEEFIKEKIKQVSLLNEERMYALSVKKA